MIISARVYTYLAQLNSLGKDDIVTYTPLLKKKVGMMEVPNCSKLLNNYHEKMIGKKVRRQFQLY